MKHIILLVILSLFLGNSFAQKATKYAIKSGYLKLKIDGNSVGTKEIWWDDFGDKTRELEKTTTTVKMFGIKDVTELNKLTIIVKDHYWTVDYTDNTGATGPLPYYEESHEYVDNMTEAEREQMANDLLISMGGSKLGDETINGYKCEKFTLMGSIVWTYKGISLKSEANVMGIETNEMFEVFEPNSSVAASKFVAPTNITYKDMNVAMQQAGQQGLMGAMAEMESQDGYYDDDDDEENVPVKYPLDKFRKATANFSYKNYISRGADSRDGIHAAMFMSGMDNVIAVMAQSRQNSDMQDLDDAPELESFSHNGHKCYFGQMEEDDGAALIVEYPSYDMYIVVMCTPKVSRQEALEIYDKFSF